MLKIGLTGGIGSGKSTVARIFETLGIPVYYADDAAKRLYETDAELIALLQQHFGDEIFSGSRIDRARLAAKVFHSPEDLAILNALVHPRTIRDAENWMKIQTAPYVIKEAALIFESGSGASLNSIIGVSAPLAVRMERVMQRDNSTPENFLSRSSRQIDENIKMKLCDYVIFNDEQQAVIPQVLELHKFFLTQDYLKDEN